MGAAASTELLVVGATWRLTGLEKAGRALVAAAAGGAENERTIAGMMLVKAGDRSVPLISEAIMAGATSAVLVDILASIGTPAARAALEQARQGQPEIADAAEEALRTLDKIDRREK